MEAGDVCADENCIGFKVVRMGLIVWVFGAVAIDLPSRSSMKPQSIVALLKRFEYKLQLRLGIKKAVVPSFPAKIRYRHQIIPCMASTIFYVIIT
jgi:hypothetical protein